MSSLSKAEGLSCFGDFDKLNGCGVCPVIFMCKKESKKVKRDYR
jgi:hypothetical protein